MVVTRERFWGRRVRVNKKERKKESWLEYREVRIKRKWKRWKGNKRFKDRRKGRLKLQLESKKK